MNTYYHPHIAPQGLPRDEAVRAAAEWMRQRGIREIEMAEHRDEEPSGLRLLVRVWLRAGGEVNAASGMLLDGDKICGISTPIGPPGLMFVWGEVTDPAVVRALESTARSGAPSGHGGEWRASDGRVRPSLISNPNEETP